jgi:SNF2 family DNA or RNA helicase
LGTPHQDAERARILVSKKKKDRVFYKYKTPPYHHQIEALKKLLSTGWGGALLMEPRTGKTKVAIDYASAMHQAGHINRVLVVSPVGVMGVWEEEIPKHCPFPHTFTLWDKRARKNGELPKFGHDRLDFVITNYDAASTPATWRRSRKRETKGQIAWFELVGRRNVEVSRIDPETGKINTKARRLRARRVGGRYEFQNKIKAWQPQLIILDESHRIKSPSAAKSRIFHKLGPLAPYRIIMTGTVVTKKKRIFDVFSQWRFLYPRRFLDDVGEPMNFGEFKEHYSVIRKVGDLGYPKWIRNKNEAELHRLIHQDSYSVLREDCFDMPPLTEQVIPVHLGEETLEAYDQMAEDMVARIRSGEIVEASIALVLGLRLRQLSNGIAKTMPTKEHPKGALRIIGSDKLQTLEDRLEDLMEAGEHVIIGASFRADIQRIHKLCQKRRWKSWIVMGGVKPVDRTRIRREFEAHEDGCVFIGNPQAASEGIDLRSAAILIWYSLPTSWVNYRQYMDRNALHTGPRFVEYLLASPADHLVYETLLEDGDMGKRMITSPERLLRR